MTNVNLILSELGVDCVNSRFNDTSWKVSILEGEKLKAKAVEFLSDKEFLRHVEDALDEDRECGEWINP